MRANATSTTLILMALMGVMLLPSDALAGRKERKEAKRVEKRQKIDEMARETLDQLLEDSAAARRLFQKADGYAVFDNTRVTFGLSGGGGRGVAVDKASGERTYMKMGTGGLAAGIGAQKYQVVFLFEDAETFEGFLDEGWEAEAGANAAAGTEGANAEATFRNGVAYWQLTEKGLILSADISGTRYWKDDKLNE